MVRAATARERKRQEKISAIRQQLRRTKKPFSQITREVRTPRGLVRSVNHWYEIRSLEQIEALRKAANLKSNPRYNSRKKVGFFSSKKKWALIEKNKRAIYKVAWKWYRKSKILQSRVGLVEDLAHDIFLFLFKDLDYYDPSVRGWKGRSASPVTWMVMRTELYCKNKVSMLSKNKELSMTKKMYEWFAGGDVASYKLLMDGHPTPQRPLLPEATQHFIRNFGLNPRELTARSYKVVKEIILAAANAPAAGLSSKQKDVVKLRFEGLTLSKIAKKRRVTHQAVQINAAMATAGIIDYLRGEAPQQN